MKKFKWAFIGCGDIARITAKEILASGKGEIVSLWNRTPERAHAFAKVFGGTVYDTAEQAILAPEVDGVYVAVTADQHKKYMLLCIRHHKHVLCEKPFTVNAKDAQDVFDAAKREGVYVSEAMWTWHNATALQVKSWLSSDFIGPIQEVNCAYSFPMIKFSRKPRHLQAELIAGALLDIGVYCIRYCYELFGYPREIRCEGRLQNGFDLGERITLCYDGFNANLVISRDENDGEYFEITGTTGVISVPMFHMARKARLKGTGISGKFKDNTLLYGNQFANVADEIRSGASEGNRISAQSTIDCLKILDECRRQMGLVYPCEME